MVFTTIDPSLTPSIQNNILDNGGLEIWQRGNTFTFNTASFSTVNVYTADRWSNQAWWASGSPVWTVTREASTIHGGQFSLKFNMTALGVTLQDQRMVAQAVENYQGYLGKTMNFSAWVNTTSSHVNLRLTDGITTALSTNHPGDGQWHQLNATLTISNSATTIQCSMSWDAQANATTGAHYLDSAMLVVGSNAPTFLPTNPQQDLARCQRYFETFGAGVPPLGLPIYNNSANTQGLADGLITYKVTKRVNPSVTITVTQIVLSLIPPGGGGQVTDTPAWTAVNDSGDLGCLAVQFQRSGAVASARVGSFQFTFTASADL